MKHPIRLFVSLILIIIAAGGAFAQDSELFPVNEIILDNGLTVLVVERPAAPVFTGYFCVGVGSADERIGNIGTAHLFEHMMFKGSESVGTTNIEAEKDLWIKEDSIWARIDEAMRRTRFIELNHPEQLEEHLKYIEDLKTILDSLTSASSRYVVQNEFDEIYTRNGAAQFNAWTMYDFTNYFVSLPSNRLELWFNMESDRLKKPALREFFPERDVVSEERRLSVENNSDSKLFEQLIGTAFIAHPYQIYWEWQSEENYLTRDDLMQFHRTYYVPQNISIAVVGDVKTEEVKKLAEKYFGDMPRGGDIEPIYTREPKQVGERRVDLHYEASPSIYIAYHKTPFDSPDEPVFRVIERILGEGRTSRLYKSLVLDRQLCLSIDVNAFPGAPLGDEFASVFIINAYPKEGISTTEVEEAIYEEINKLSATAIDAKELEKIKNNIDADYIWGSYSNIGLAYHLAIAHNLARDWRHLFNLRDKMMAVTPEDIIRVTGEYLTETNRTVATLIPIEKGEDR